MPSKRKQSKENESSLVIKKTRTDIVPVSEKVITVRKENDRTSKLLAPTMLLNGHSGPIYSFKFDPSGVNAASGSFDRSIFLWKVYGECQNYSVLSGHKNAVLDVNWTNDGKYIVSSSADKTVAYWDAETGQRLKRFKGHTGIVNSCCPVRKGSTLIVSGSDDGMVKLWDTRTRKCAHSFEGRYQVTSVAMHDDSNMFFSGSLDGVIKMWDVRKQDSLWQLEGHTDIVTGLSLSPSGSYILSNAMDDTTRKWDVRSYVNGSRLACTFYGVKHNQERHLIKCGWSPEEDLVISGSSDRNVYVWDADTAELKYRLPGHKGCVTEAGFHPKEPIIGSCGIDKNIYLGELTE